MTEYEFRKQSSWSVIGGVDFPLWESKFVASSGLELNLYASEFYQAPYESYPYEERWVQSKYALSFPLKIKYAFEPWLFISAGAVNSVLLFDENIKQPEIHFYTFGLMAGLEACILKKVILGADCYKDVSVAHEGFQEEYRWFQIRGKVGYVIH